MNETIRLENIERGVQAYQAGRFEEALDCYRLALEAVRGDAEAISLSGLALLHLGQHERAMPLLFRAVAQEPTQMGFRLNLAEGLQATRQYDRGMREVETILAAEPDNSRAWDRAGDLSARLGDEDRAAEGWVRALSLELTYVTPALKLAQLQISRRRCDLALKVLDSALAHTPGHADLLALKCDALIANRDWAGLQATVTQWLSTQPDNSIPWRALARGAFELGRHMEAANAYARVLALATPTANDLSTYGTLSLHAQNYDAASIAFAGAEALDSEHSDMLASRALLHMYFGRFAEAENCCRRTLARDPENVIAYRILSQLQRGQLQDSELAVVNRIVKTDAAPLDARIVAAFIAGDAEDARGAVDAAMTAYERAHELARQRDRADGRTHDPKVIERRMQRLQDKEWAQDADGGHSSSRLETRNVPRPIFIVGMPRSGTTLVESILSAHSRVAALGQRSVMQQIEHAFLAGGSPDAVTLQSWWASYFDNLPPIGSADHITDRHPLNFEAAGLIAHLLPDAVIVHVRRDPIETCLSIYRHEFNKHWTFAHRLADIAHYYGCYARLTAFWEKTLGPRFVSIQYEDLVENFQSAVPRLVQACGLEWEAQCLEFQRASRPIVGASSVDVRRLVRSGNGRAARYEKYLAPLIDALRK